MVSQSYADSSPADRHATLQALVDALAREFMPEQHTTSGTASSLVRLTTKEPKAHSGWCDISILRPGLFVTAADVFHEHGTERRYGGGDLLKLHFCLSGGSHISGDHGVSYNVRGASLVCFTQPADSEKYEQVAAKAHERSVTLACTRDFISDIADNCSLTLPDRIVDFARGKPSPFLCEHLPLPLETQLLVEDLMAARASPCEHLLRESRSLELLSLALQHLSTSSGAPVLCQRDHDRVRQICDVIEHEGSRTYTIKELSRLTGWNETQMMDCFKKVTGVTISSYRQRYRMEKAIRMLRTSDISVTELAFDLGYEHPGNFATAFKKTFGFPPRAVRSKH